MKIRLILRILAVLGLAISGYLLYLKLTDQITYLVGCGEGSGCAEVLGSRWSQVFLVPVTAMAMGMYLVLLISTWKPSRMVLAGLAVCFAGAAVWFYGILLFVLKEFCPWCTTAHAIGLTCALLLLQYLKKERTLKGKASGGIVGGVLAMVVLVLGQIFGPVPETHAVSTGTVEQEDREGSVHARGEGRVVSVFEDKKAYNITALPHLGAADAPHVLVKYFDFACESCLEMDSALRMVMEKQPGKFCIVMLPVPLNHACNEHLSRSVQDLEHACELARLGLAAWRANPEVYAEVHETLFLRPVLDPELAELAVAQIVGDDDAFEEALQDSWIEEVLAANNNDFRQFTAETVKMPKLLFGKDKILHGVTRTPGVLLQTLEKEFGLPAAP
ncbi:MAG: vitamin K epoxide reductase family protein [Akkermansiaceae bacterium]|nr:vitamin K epoxide reductase family protein [Akkermansiaceae bacterium]